MKLDKQTENNAQLFFRNVIEETGQACYFHHMPQRRDSPDPEKSESSLSIPFVC